MRVLVSVLVAASIFVIGPAQADNPQPTEVVVLTFGKIEHTYKTDGSSGPDMTVKGTLHIASQAFLSAGGIPLGFTLHTNLSDTFAIGVDGNSYVAVGAWDGIPAECEPTACAPPFWTLTFRLVSNGALQKPSLLFDLTLKTEYAADGTLLSACVAGEDGCDIGRN